jgi:hypothetical protein
MPKLKLERGLISQNEGEMNDNAMVVSYSIVTTKNHDSNDNEHVLQERNNKDGTQ